MSPRVARAVFWIGFNSLIFGANLGAFYMKTVMRTTGTWSLPLVLAGAAVLAVVVAVNLHTLRSAR